MCIGQKEMSDVLLALHALIFSLETESFTDLGLVTQSCNLSTCGSDLGVRLAASKPKDPSIPNLHNTGVAGA